MIQKYFLHYITIDINLQEKANFCDRFTKSSQSGEKNSIFLDKPLAVCYNTTIVSREGSGIS